MDNTTNHPKRKRSKKRRDIIIDVLIGLITVTVVITLLVWGIRRIVNQPEAEIAQPDQASPIGEQNQQVSQELDGGASFQFIEQLSAGNYIYEGPIANIAKHDFPFFSDISQLDTDYLLSFGIWEVLSQSRFEESILYDEDGIYVPQESVMECIRLYFPITTQPEFKTVSIYGDFKYLEDTHQYEIPVFGVEDMLIPRVADKHMDTSHGTVTLTIDYISSNDLSLYEMGETLSPPEQIKSVMLTLKQSGEVYQILSLEQVNPTDFSQEQNGSEQPAES